jgi:archaellum component FlaG (FlaF/FlaG flagellin family)
MTTRTRYTAEYLYPGSFMPEETYVTIPEPTLSAAIVYGPDEPGYFSKDGWYAVLIKTVTEKQYVSDDGDVTWLREGQTEVEKIIVGREVHVDSPEISGPEHNILRSNIRGNSRDPYKNLAVHTRSGNWQIRSDWDRVVAL